MAIYRNRLKFNGDPGSGSNILVKYDDKREIDEVILDEAIADIEKRINEGGVEYVTTLPTGEDIMNTVYGIEHAISETKTTNKIDDVIGSYMHLDGDKYVPNDGATIVREDYGTVTQITEEDNLHYKLNNDLVVYKFDTSKTFTITITESHIDFYVGDKENQTTKQLATIENVTDEYLHKSEKGTPGGLATLDVNGKIPISELPTGSEIYLGTYDASTGVYPSSEGLVPGCYYRISVAGTIESVSYYINDKLIWNGTAWEKITNSEAVVSVNEKQGEVVLTGADIIASINNDAVFGPINDLLTNNVLCTDDREQIVEGKTHFSQINGYKGVTDNESLTIECLGEEGCYIAFGGRSGVINLGGYDVRAQNKNIVTKVDGNLADNYGEVTSTWGKYKDDLATENTKDTCVPVLTNGTIQHRVIPTNLATTDGYVRELSSSTDRSGAWISSRDNAQVKNKTAATNSGYAPVTSFKTAAGEWSFGNLASDAENLYFSHTTDANYNAGNNSANTCYLQSNCSGYIVTTGNISSALPSGNVTGSLSGTTLTLYIK